MAIPLARLQPPPDRSGWLGEHWAVDVAGREEPSTSSKRDTPMASEFTKGYTLATSSKSWGKRKLSEVETESSKGRKYACSFAGCDKSYTKPCRLQEHERAHTGERPFQCAFPSCSQSYMRASHLSAHARTHIAAPSVAEAATQDAIQAGTGKAKPFACPNTLCSKRFWTKQHQERHIEAVHDDTARIYTSEVDGEQSEAGPSGKKRRKERPGGEGAYRCTEPNCSDTFRKRKHQRAHIWEAHSDRTVANAGGTDAGEGYAANLPFACNFDGCTRRFKTNAKRRQHAKTHDPGRYSCALAHTPEQLSAYVDAYRERLSVATHDGSASDQPPTPFPAILHFPTWTALQQHTRQAHPPTCLRPGCQGRTFARSENLAAHMRRHAVRDIAISAALEASHAQSTFSDDSDALDDLAREERLLAAEHEAGRDFACNFNEEHPPTSEACAKGNYEPCTRRFKSAHAMRTHVRVFHLGERPFACENEGCGKRYGHKHLLKKHAVRCGHRGEDQEAAEGGDEEEVEADDDDYFRAEGGAVPERDAERSRTRRVRDGGSGGDAAEKKRKRQDGDDGNAEEQVARETAQRKKLLRRLTGAGYGEQAEPSQIQDGIKRRTTRGRVVQCPWHIVQGILDTDSDNEADCRRHKTPPSLKPCAFRFSRLYDVRRHMSSRHGLDLSDAELRAVVPEEQSRLLAKPRKTPSSSRGPTPA